MNLGKNDMEKIAENWEGVLKYGTCYALIQPASKWENPYCMESVTGECKGEGFLDPFSGSDMVSHALEYAICAIEHHRPMRFSTIKGEKEGLTMMSTLLCGKRGIITIEASGQIYIEPKTVNEEIGDIEERIECLIRSVVGASVESSEELKGLSTMEVLSRLIYQEDRASQKGQNAVLFSIVNRLFSTGTFVLERENNNLYSVIADSGQYESIEKDTGKEYSGFRPPISKEDNELEKEDDKPEEDDETYQEVINFIQQQKNIKGGLIINEVGTRDSFQGYPTDKYEEEKHGGNYFNWLASE